MLIDEIENYNDQEIANIIYTLQQEQRNRTLRKQQKQEEEFSLDMIKKIDNLTYYITCSLYIQLVTNNTELYNLLVYRMEPLTIFKSENSSVYLNPGSYLCGTTSKKEFCEVNIYCSDLNALNWLLNKITCRINIGNYKHTFDVLKAIDKHNEYLSSIIKKYNHSILYSHPAGM